jgi:hypothetical protein
MSGARHDGSIPQPGYHRRVLPQVLIVVGFLLLAAGVLILLSFGPRFRVGRLLAATPEASIDQARDQAQRGREVYIRVQGRIDSETDFEDAAHRPLVYRRTRIQLRPGRRWTTVDETLERVPFQLNEGLESIAIDDERLDIGLVVIPRESVGVAADISDRVPDGTRPDIPARAVIEQISAVEHAIALGTPELRPDGTLALTAGTGRPLILTTLERDEAMRVLTGGDRRRSFAVVTLLGAGVLLVAGGLLAGLLDLVR